jgi:hypothetical protein
MISSQVMVPGDLCFPLDLHQKGVQAWRWACHVLNKHTDLISSVGILTLTTCLLAAKIFPKIPPIWPRLSLVILNFGGIIWLNVQVRDFIKNVRDLSFAAQMRELSGVLLTAVKVLVRGIDILLTCGLFTASVVASCGYPHTTLLMYASMRPFAILSLAMGVMTEICNYFINERLLAKIEKKALEGRLKQVMQCFVDRVLCQKQDRQAIPHLDQLLAVHIIRQLDMSTLEIFQERLKISSREDDEESVNIFHAMKTSIQNKQAATEASLFLTALGYVSMGICKIFPGSLAEIGLRWGMSVLYTDELIKQKLFQSDLAQKM